VRALGMGELRDAVDVALYFVRGKLAPEELSLLGRFLLSDPWRKRLVGERLVLTFEATRP